MRLLDNCCWQGNPGDSRVILTLGYAVAEYAKSLTSPDDDARRLIDDYVVRLDDTKGDLTVYYRGFIPADMAAAFRTAWREAGYEAAENVHFRHHSARD